jgi:hypothetical protein
MDLATHRAGPLVCVEKQPVTASRQLGSEYDHRIQLIAIDLSHIESGTERRREQPGWRRPLNLSLWYWQASGYGEKPWLAALWRVGFERSKLQFTSVISRSNKDGSIVSETEARVNDVTGEPLDRVRKAFAYSLQAATLERPKPKPLTKAARLAVSIQTVLIGAQTALLLLAIRRKFRR